MKKLFLISVFTVHALFTPFLIMNVFSGPLDYETIGTPSVTLAKMTCQPAQKTHWSRR